MKYINTKDQIADIFTKGFTNPEKYSHALDLINHFTPAKVEKRPKRHFSEGIDQRKIGQPKEEALMHEDS